MEGFWVLLVLAIMAAVIGVPVWLVANILRLRGEREADRKQANAHWADLTARLYHIEKELEKLRNGPPGVASQPPTNPSATHETSPVATKKTPIAETSVAEQPPPRFPVPPPTGSPEPPRTPPPAPPAAPMPVIPPPAIQAGQASPRTSLDLEELLGTNWLNKIGITILVLGLAFFLAYQLKNLGPGGKVAMGLALSAGMIAAGIRYESNDRYRILARASAAGGWSLLFFISYAVYHVPAAHLIDSRELDLLLMLMVAGTIVWYSLRYRSETTTALALFLAFLTTTVHRGSIYSLAAGVVLAITVVAIALRMRWFALELFGIFGVYFGHFMWLYPVVEARSAPVEFPGFRLSAALLAFYWLLFRSSYVVRQPVEGREKEISNVAALVNAFLLMVMLRYQSVHPEWTFWTLLTLGAAEVIFSAWASRRSRSAFALLSTLGSAFLLAAFPFRYSGSDLSLLWLIGAEVFFLSGLLTREIVFRRMGMLAMLLVTGSLVSDNVSRFLSLITASNVEASLSLAILFGVAALFFYFNSLQAPKIWRDASWTDFDFVALHGVTYLGGFLALLSLSLGWPGMWTAVAWGALCVALCVAGRFFAERSLSIQGNLVAACALFRAATLNLSSTDTWHRTSLRLITIVITAALLYVASLYAGDAVAEKEGAALLSGVHTVVASGLLAVLAYHELPRIWVAVAWALGGLVLLEIGLLRRLPIFRWQAYAALTAGFLRLLFVNLGVERTTGSLSPRLYTVLPIAGMFFYSDWRLRQTQSSGTPECTWAGIASAYFGTISLAGLLYFEVMAVWVGAAWAAMALVWVALAYVLRRNDFGFQSMLLAAAAFLRAITFNLTQASPAGLPFSSSQTFYVGSAVLLLFGTLPFGFLLRKRAEEEPPAWLWERRPEQVFFFVPFILLTILIASESTRSGLTVTWGIEGVLVFISALVLGERSFRLAGLGLLLICVLKIILMDVWGLEPQARYITLIFLGAALVLVSFLYTRNREKFRKYL